jgi:small subunit ribosomal protein S27Ae
MSKKTEAVKKPEKVVKTPEQPPKAEVKPEKPEKPETAKREKRKREEKGIFTLYKVEADKVLRLRPTCERCGTGYFMADHGNRYTCGHCGFTRYKPAQNEHV